ncbi:MAG: hypothetical protein JW704_09810 [Anaerolineaceae bacterium]|nr:hypothetical protein [Anaerolineaceae bacterium]
MEDVSRDMKVMIPFAEIIKVAEDAGSKELRNLMSPWSVVMRDIEGKYYTVAFEDQSGCAGYVAHCHGGEDTVVYVLKNGIPRKSVKIEVKARFR